MRKCRPILPGENVQSVFPCHSNLCLVHFVYVAKKPSLADVVLGFLRTVHREKIITHVNFKQLAINDLIICGFGF